MNLQVLIGAFEMGERKELRVAAIGQGQLLGTANVNNPGAMAATIYQVHVDKEWRGQGIGKAIVAKIEEACWKLGSQSVSIIVDADGPVEFWTKLGYRPVHLENGKMIAAKLLEDIAYAS